MVRRCRRTTDDDPQSPAFDPRSSQRAQSSMKSYGGELQANKRPKQAWLIPVAAITFLLLLIGAALALPDMDAPPHTGDSSSASFPSSSVVEPMVEVAMALVQLSALAIEGESNAAYDRDTYGERWFDVESNGCNQRDDRLLMDALLGTVVTGVQGDCDHDVLAGQWLDPYTGELLIATDLKDQTQAMSITIDHVVPLAEAHRSGASGWDAERQLLFANDLPSLRVVAGDVNSAKSDQDPAHWLPYAPAVCWYATLWVGIKTTWQLTIDPAEHAALEDILAGCS